MTSRRVLKVAEAIREVVSMAIIADLKDPRISDVTVTYVEVTPDMRHAKVHISIMGDDAKQSLCLHGLRSSAGYLQSKIGQRIDTRYTPRLAFHLDQGVKKAIEITRILSDVLPMANPGGTQDGAEENLKDPVSQDDSESIDLTTQDETPPED